jgi:hypothetical protein
MEPIIRLAQLGYQWDSCNQVGNVGLHFLFASCCPTRRLGFLRCEAGRRLESAIITRTMFARISHWLHQRLLGLLLVAYAAATVLPGPGLRLRETSLGTLHLGNQDFDPIAAAGLAALQRGLGMKLSDLRSLFLGVHGRVGVGVNRESASFRAA